VASCPPTCIRSNLDETVFLSPPTPVKRLLIGLLARGE
jgi:hypothetical protein